MLEQPRGYGFARYTYRPQEITMGYEYENKHLMHRGHTLRDMEIKQKAVKDTLALLPNYFQAEYEGFGNSSGVEIKSVVAPLFLHKQFWNRFVSKIPFDMTANSNSNDSGIHVSISRTPETEAVKDIVFSFLHDPANRETFFRMSKRTRGSFEINAPSNPLGNTIQRFDRINHRWISEYHNPAAWSDHYNIINTENNNRFEFRLFAAHPTLLLPALEMCDSLFKMADGPITIASWRTYISKFKKYEHIKAHCIACLDTSIQ